MDWSKQTIYYRPVRLIITHHKAVDHLLYLRIQPHIVLFVDRERVGLRPLDLLDRVEKRDTEGMQRG